MELKTKLFAILVIFCVLLSACAVSAAVGDDVDINNSYGDVDVDISGMDNIFDGTQRSYNETDLSSLNDTAQNHTDMNSTGNATANVTANSTVHAAGSDVANATNATATAKHPMLSTGNPIVALLGVCLVFGGYTILRRK